MEDLELHKNRMLNSYESLLNVLDESFIVNNNTFTIMDLEHTRHSKFDDLEITIRYKRKVNTLKLFATKDGIFNVKPYNEIGHREIVLGRLGYLSNPDVLKGVCKEIRLHTQSFFWYYNDKEEILGYLNQEDEQED